MKENMSEKEQLLLTKKGKKFDDLKLIAVVNGIVSVGKSTFINSLIGMNLLPSKTGETTANITIIEHN